jgi:H+/Cl- antiporter ClcA
MGYAVVLGVFGAVAGLVFIGLITFGGRWYSDSDPGWFGGHWWWVAVAAAAGAVVGLLRRLTRLPQKVPGLVDDLQTEHVDPRLVPGIVAVSTVSLIGGASLGPEKALGSMGGGAGSWLAQRRAFSKEDSQVNTLAGFAGAYGGLFSSTIIVVLLILEVARRAGSDSPRPSLRDRGVERLIRHLLRHRRRRLPGHYQVPSYEFEGGSYWPGFPLACSRPWW